MTNSFFPFADGTEKLSGRDYEFWVPTLRREQLVRSGDLSGEIQGESEESQPAEPTDDAEARTDFWSIQGDFIYRHHTEPRVQLYVPKEETFSIPRNYIDVTRTTHTDLDVMQEKKMDDYWNVDSCKHVSDSWRGFTKFTLLIEASKRLHVAQEETDNDSNETTARPDHVWPEVWTKIGEAAQNREKQQWAKEKLKLDNARAGERDLLHRSVNTIPLIQQNKCEKWLRETSEMNYSITTRKIGTTRTTTSRTKNTTM